MSDKDKYSDRFSDASKELPEKSAYVCESCDTKYSKEDAQKKENTCCGRSLREIHQESFGP